MLSKLGPLVSKAHADAGRMAQAGSRVAKVVDACQPAADLLAVQPSLIILGRTTPDNLDLIGLAAAGVEPEAEARAWVERQASVWRQEPLIKIWEGPSEPAVGDGQGPASLMAMAWYAGFEAERLRLLADLGLRGVVGNFASGAPADPALWLAFLPALEAVERCHGFLGWQAYGAPWLWPADGPLLGYRAIYRDYLAPNGFGETPLIITAGGLDPAQGGWRAQFDFWASQDGASDPVDYWRGPERDPERYYAEQWLWYERELQQDAYVVGALVSVAGQEAQDIGGTRVLPVLLEAIRNMAASPAPAAPEPQPAVVAPAPEPVLTQQPPAPETFVVPPGPEAGRARAANNLLSNASFEAGRAYYHAAVRELAVPEGWTLAYESDGTPILPGQSTPWGRPVTALINSRSVAAADRQRVFAGGRYCWKAAAPQAPAWLRLTQTVSGLRRGQRYAWRVNLLPDLVQRTHPSLAYASDPLAGEARLSARFPELVFDAGWKNGREIPFGRYTPVTLEFTASSARVEVSVEVRGRWAWPLGAWYIDELSVTEV